MIFKWRRRVRYYHIKPKKDERNKIAQVVDFSVAVFVIWLVAFLFLGQFLELFLALPGSLLVAAAGGVAARCYYRRQNRLRKQRDWLWVNGQRCRKELEKIKTREELAFYTSLLLAQLPHFTDLIVKQNDIQGELRIDEVVALTVKHKGNPVAVQCVLSDPYAKEEVEQLVKLKRFIEERNFTKALIVAPGGLSKRARRVIADLKRVCRVVLWDKEKLIELALRARQQPLDKDAQESTIRHEKDYPLIFDPKKIAGYLCTAVTLGLVFLISRPALSIVRFLYFSLIVLNIVFALLAFFLLWKAEGDWEELKPVE